MKRHLITITALFLLLGGAASAQNNSAKAEDEKAVRAVIQAVADAWTAGDGKKFGEPFASDADYIVINGLYLKGRAAIAESHQQIFDTFYKDTKLRLDIRKIRFINDSVVLVHTEGSIVKKSEEFSKKPTALPGFVLNKEKGKWQIVAFQNTRIEESR